MFWFLCVLAVNFFSCCYGSSRPNIVMILADDLGWNDLSFHGSDQIPTPNIDAMAYSGIILNSHYVLPICTPSRAALMTGMYPFHIGMQGLPMLPSEPRGLPQGKILPQYLKDLGYRTAAVGKWHLGYHREDFLPTNRGFDSFLGYYNGFISYYDYIIQESYPNNVDVSGFDMRRNNSPAYDLVGQYATTMFTDQAVKTIRKHDKENPLFLYLSHLAVHSGARSKLLEASPDDLLAFRHIADPNRRTYAAMVAALDRSVGRIVAALEESGMLQNSIIVFMSDNGAPTVGRFPNWGSNFPFRGLKETLWEGGVRGAALVWSPLLEGSSKVSNQLMHVTDWLPTLYTAAGGNSNDLPAMDGKNLWPTLAANYPSPRTDVLLNIDESRQIASLRVNTPKYFWKVVLGSVQNGTYDGYYGQGSNQAPERNPRYNTIAVTETLAYRSLERMHRRFMRRPPVQPQRMLQLRKEATVRCPDGPRRPCNPVAPPNGPGDVCLFDLRTDPCEMNNLTPLYPNVARYLFKALVIHRRTLVPQLNRPLEIELANPALFNGTWSPWYDLNGVPYAFANTIPDTDNLFSVTDATG